MRARHRVEDLRKAKLFKESSEHLVSLSIFTVLIHQHVLECIFKLLIIITDCWRNEVPHFSFKIRCLAKHLLLINKLYESLWIWLVEIVVSWNLLEVHFRVFLESFLMQFSVFFELCAVV